MPKEAKTAASQRLAEALRANLHRRKAAAKERATAREQAHAVDPHGQSADEDKSRG